MQMEIKRKRSSNFISDKKNLKTVNVNSSTFPTLGIEVLQNNSGLVIYQLGTLGKLLNSSESQLLLLSSEAPLQDVQEH